MQAVGIYIAAGNAFNQKVIAYRWETETPVGHWGKTVYSSVMDVWFYCLRNKDDGIGVWYEETRNIREDFLAKFGYVPENIGIAVCGNSQNSQSDALAEVDYIGFYEEKSVYLHSFGRSPLGNLGNIRASAGTIRVQLSANDVGKGNRLLRRYIDICGIKRSKALQNKTA